MKEIPKLSFAEQFEENLKSHSFEDRTDTLDDVSLDEKEDALLGTTATFSPSFFPKPVTEFTPAFIAEQLALYLPPIDWRIAHRAERDHYPAALREIQQLQTECRILADEIILLREQHT